MNELNFTDIIKRGDTGAQIKLIQEWLCLHNHKVVIDSEFGPATEVAVRAFQGAKQLPHSGTVDRDTFEALVAPMATALKPIPVGSKTLGELVAAYARMHLLQHPREVGGQNRGPWVRLYTGGKEGKAYPWCMGAATYWVGQACKAMGIEMPFQPSLSCDMVVKNAKNVGRFIKEPMAMDRKKLPTGSLFVIRKSSDDWVHTGIVTLFNAETFTSIEGNANSEGSREGYEVCSLTRGYRGKDFILI